MRRLRDSRCRFLNNIVELPSSPSLSSDTSFKIESSDNHFKTHNMENMGNTPPQNDPPHDNRQHDNPLYGNRSLQDYLHTPRKITPSCIMFPPSVQHQEGYDPIVANLPCV